MMQNTAEIGGSELVVKRFRSISRALHGHFSKLKMTAMFKAFIDDSADGKKAEIFLFAGWLGSEDAWAFLISEWIKRIGKEEERDKKEIVFHMTDCEASGGDFRGWDRKRADELVIDLAEIICQADIKAFGAGIRMPDYKKVMSDNPGMKKCSWLKDPLFIVAGKCIEEIGVYMQALPLEEITFAFDWQQRFRGSVLEYFDEGARKSEYGSRFLGLSFYSRKALIPLQVADLLAWEVKKEWERQLWNKSNPERKYCERSSFSIIRDKIGGAITYYEEASLTALVNWLSEHGG